MWFLDNINTTFDWWPFAAIKHKDGDNRKLQEMSYFVEKAAQFRILSGLRMPNCSVACSLCMPDPYTAAADESSGLRLQSHYKKVFALHQCQ
jgi:hypothetical protein